MDSTAIIIANPAAGNTSRRAISIAEAALRQRGIIPILRPTLHAGHAEALAREAASESPSMIIAAGGDGTINEVINGMASSPVPLGIIPLGTANVLALATGIPLSPQKAIEHVLNIKTPRRICLGTIEASGRKRHFCLMAGIGFDAETVRTLSLPLKRKVGKLAYVASAIRVLGSWKPLPMVVRVDGVEHTCHHVIVCKAPKYAGRFTIAPQARLDEPEFEAVMIEGSGRMDILRFAGWMVLGKAGFGARVARGRVIEISGASPVQLDGDFFGLGPSVFRAQEAWLQLLY